VRRARRPRPLLKWARARADSGRRRWRPDLRPRCRCHDAGNGLRSGLAHQSECGHDRRSSCVHVQGGTLGLDTPIAALLPTWRGAERAAVRVRHLLDHSSGLPAHRRLWEQARGRDAFERAIAETPSDALPGTRSVYSDLGFMLLGFVLADIAGGRWTNSGRTGGAARCPPRAILAFGLPASAWLLADSNSPGRSRANGNSDPLARPGALWRKCTTNAAALGGVAAHAGLFGTAHAGRGFARLVLQTFQSVHAATAHLTPCACSRSRPRARIPRARWDTMRPTSSCGALMSRPDGDSSMTPETRPHRLPHVGGSDRISCVLFDIYLLVDLYI